MVVRRFWFFILGLAAFVGCVVAAFCWSARPASVPLYGFTFSPGYAAWLGYDSVVLFERILNDMPFTLVRIPVPWSEVEKVRGSFSFEQYDALLAIAEQYNVRVLLALGQKVPRWPECHIPAWAEDVAMEDYRRAVMNYIETAVRHFKTASSVEAWQIENEAYVPFGACDSLVTNIIPEEIERVRTLDGRPIVVADSGELSLWHRSSRLSGDYFGTTLYRSVWNRYLGYFTYWFIPPFAYRARAQWNGIDATRLWLVEFQAEPWLSAGDLHSATLEEQLRTMNPSILANNLAFAHRVGFSRIYAWGVEWWYYLADNKGDHSMIETGQHLFSSPVIPQVGD